MEGFVVISLGVEEGAPDDLDEQPDEPHPPHLAKEGVDQEGDEAAGAADEVDEEEEEVDAADTETALAEATDPSVLGPKIWLGDMKSDILSYLRYYSALRASQGRVLCPPCPPSPPWPTRAASDRPSTSSPPRTRAATRRGGRRPR